MVLAALFGAVLLSAAGCAGSNSSFSTNRVGVGTASVVGSGVLVTTEPPVDNFNELDVDSALRVDVTRGDAYRVAVTSDDNVIDFVIAEKSGNTLKLGLKPGSYVNSSVKVAVVMPDLVAIRMGGASAATISGFRPETLGASLRGASQLTGRLEAGSVTLTVAESSKANVGGTAQTLVFAASGAGQGSLGDLLAGTAKVTMKEASTATLNVKSRLDADLRSASTLYYVGNPSLGTITSLEASSVRRR